MTPEQSRFAHSQGLVAHLFRYRGLVKLLAVIPRHHILFSPNDEWGVVADNWLHHPQADWLTEPDAASIVSRMRRSGYEVIAYYKEDGVHNKALLVRR